MSDPTLTSSLLNNRRRRAMIACTNCRRRKIKCVTSEEPPRNPCARCTKRSLPCEYVAVDEDSPTPESPVLLPNSGAYPYAPSAPYGGAPSGGFPYAPPPSPYSGGWNPPQQPHPSHPGYAIPPQPQYRPSSSSSYAPGGMYAGPTGFPSNVQYYQQQQSFSAAPPPAPWAQGSAQQSRYVIGSLPDESPDFFFFRLCLCPSPCPQHRRY
ncbi:hypothetical protein B0H17DRAFT_1048134 [Mycena rosella]|uniref:Zn(2)-C6 fungal-type domain-containing protein n=1 Tax=Mycena rosella TaxID=1033263 RepID=A0AAD7DVK3_MYCRO|nr:hypothetical protein B0H17DRAFT_1048134 [Mycena rosella]